VDSILSQEYKNLEIILVDDGSPDNCPAICDAYAAQDPRVKVIHKENGGASSARNAALRTINGSYVVFIDSDDYVNEDYLSEMMKYDADVVVTESNNTTGLHSISEIKENYYSWGGFVGPCQKLYKRRAVEGVWFREDVSVGEDIVFNLAVLQRIQNAWYIPYKGYNVVENPASLTRKKSGRYDQRMDEEYQTRWGEILSSALKEAGIFQKTTAENDKNGCSVWIYQKIINYCYSDCPHPLRERIRRIKNQLEGNRDMILAVREPTSPKTYAIIKLCTLIREPHVVYGIFKLLVWLKR
jgi:glycosyltransferase involved in cell wall biosynthesis